MQFGALRFQRESKTAALRCHVKNREMSVERISVVLLLRKSHGRIVREITQRQLKSSEKH
jgi:hypothetical protein